MTDDVGRGLVWPLWVDDAVTGSAGAVLSLPAGMVTFLLSDVEGSTRRWEAAPAAMAVAVPRHYELLDAVIVGHGGVRPVEQGEGDSVVGAFSRASDAVAAAIAAQRAFADEPWPEGAELSVRIAVHTGEADLHGHRFYLGHTLNRCARIRSAAHGGQIVVSAATASLVADRLPERTSLVDLGQHRLKDLGRPEHLWQLIHPDLPGAFPALRSMELFRHNLPVQLTPLIGRAEEIVGVHELLARERLVTLTGAGGVGKSRLALAVAAETLDDSPGGVWWVELAPLADPDAIGRVALAALGAREAPGAVAVEQLAVELGSQPALLVLDNCEHLVGACAELVAGLLVANPSCSVITTSREPLGVPGEIVWRVPSMRCPRQEAAVDVPALSQYEAVLLFVERARRARPSFGVTEANAPAIAQICQRLDGIPLAIELAAARCRQMSAEQIALELDDRFRLLTGGARTVMARQQTLAASVAWSFDRLDNGERLTMRRLGVFAGPFPLDAAEHVVAAAGTVAADEVFDLVSRLVDKSLVVVDEGPAARTRYRLLETLRAYALDEAAASDELTSLRDAHAQWWAEWLTPRGEMPADDLLVEIEEYHANLKAGLDWSSRDAERGLAFLTAVARPWDELGRTADAIAAADRLLTDENAERLPTAWLEAAWRSSFLYAAACGEPEALSILSRIERLADQLGDTFYSTLARLLNANPSANALTRDLAHDRGDRYVELWVTIELALGLAQDAPAEAGPAIAAAVAAAEASGMRSFRLAARLASALLAMSTGELVQAVRARREVGGEDVVSMAGDVVLSAAALLARDGEALHGAVGFVDQAERIAPGKLGWYRDTRHRMALLDETPSVVDVRTQVSDYAWPPTVMTFWLEGREAVDAGACDVAVRFARHWARPMPHSQAAAAAIEAVADGDDEDRWHDALAIALDQGLRLIATDAFEGLAVAAARLEGWAECLRLVAAGQRLRDETGYRWRFAGEQIRLERARDAARLAVPDAVEVLEREGAGLDWREAAAYARRARGERKRPSSGWASLTPTEQRVVALVAEGLTNPEIAERLLMGRATVKTHLNHTFTKLGVRTRAELAAEFARRSSPPPGRTRS